jgi:hypothetical protein
MNINDLHYEKKCGILDFQKELTYLHLLVTISCLEQQRIRTELSHPQRQRLQQREAWAEVGGGHDT